MPRNEAQKINDALVALPQVDRVAALACSLIVGIDPDSPSAVAILIEAATVLAKHLPPEQRAGVVWHLRAAAEELNARWQ
jgi:hypothetical protein